MRQAELESSQSHLDSLQSSTSELQFQLRELTDRSSLLAEELADAQRELEYSAQRPSISADDTARIRAASEAKYEVRISELTSRLAEVERDRNDTETALSKNLQQKTQEIEALRRTVDASSRNKGVSEEELTKLRQEIESLQRETLGYKQQLSELDHQRDRVNELEVSSSISHIRSFLLRLVLRLSYKGKMRTSRSAQSSRKEKLLKLKKERAR